MHLSRSRRADDDVKGLAVSNQKWWVGRARIPTDGWAV
jgi:hypothetical protein